MVGEGRANPNTMDLNHDAAETKMAACRAYARMMNTLDYGALEPWLADDFQYTSHWVFTSITSKADYEAYIVPKLRNIKRGGCRIWAELAFTRVFGAGPCVVVAQGEPDRWIATLLITLRGDTISKAVLCAIPAPEDCERTGELPT